MANVKVVVETNYLSSGEYGTIDAVVQALEEMIEERDERISDLENEVNNLKDELDEFQVNN